MWCLAVAGFSVVDNQYFTQRPSERHRSSETGITASHNDYVKVVERTFHFCKYIDESGKPMKRQWKSTKQQH
jgi:hypothetical protein